MVEPNTPVPDPTAITTEQILREVENATKLLQAEMKGLRGVFNEQLSSVHTQFELIERQRVEQKADTEKAVQAALSAAKEAVKEQTTAFALATDKSERAMTEQLKQLAATFTQANSAVTDTVGDLKERVGTVENRKAGEDKSDSQFQAWKIWVAGIGGTFVITLVIILANLLTSKP